MLASEIKFPVQEDPKNCSKATYMSGCGITTKDKIP